MRPLEALAAYRDEVLTIAAAHDARNLRVFGSAVKGQDRPDSDVDPLVDLPPETLLLRIVGIQPALADALRVPVDLCTERELRPALKDRILGEAWPL